MERIIKAAIERGASDLHIKAGDVFRARVDGRLVPLTKQVLTPDQTKAIALQLIARAEDRRRIDELTDYDCSWGLAGVGRFRVNILRQRSSFMIVMRVIPMHVPTFEQLNLPGVLGHIVQVERGLVLVTGVTGSGKTSTIAAMVNYLNQHHHKHIVTLENPIEFLHKDHGCSITQREVGVDTESFKMGLRAALRQDPDVILIGEMRDAETADTAMKAAETGHLVISTLHTSDATQTVNRIIAMFPPDEQGIARIRLAENLHAVVSQRLLPRKDGRGRMVAAEIMVATPLIRDLIVDPDRTPQIRDVIAEGRVQYGMQTFDQHLMELVRQGLISFEVAHAAATRPSDFDLQMRTLDGQSANPYHRLASAGPAATLPTAHPSQQIPAAPGARSSRAASPNGGANDGGPDIEGLQRDLGGIFDK